MVRVILKKEGKKVEIDQFPKRKYPYLENFLAILNILIDQLKNSENLDVEINLVEFRKLASELLLDNRLYSEKIKKRFDSINSLNAIAIYYIGLNGGLLLEEFREQKICYIELQQTYEINMMRIAFHELHHFFDPFIPREWQAILEDGRNFLNYEKTIKAYIRIGLNEYYANLHAFSICLNFINETLKNKVSNSSIEESNKALIEKIPSYLYKLSNKLTEFIDELRSGEIDDISIPNPKAELIQFLWSEFFKGIYYFLGGWKVYEDRELDTSLIQETWNNFIREIKNLEFNHMILLLDAFKNLMLESFDNEKELVNRVDLIFLEYYREKLESDFITLI